MVHGTKETLDHLLDVHRWGFDGGKTLLANPVVPGVQFNVGQLAVSAIASDHFPGAVNYVVEMGQRTLAFLWDLKTPPDPEDHPILRGLSLAFIAANTDTPQPTGHASSDQLVATIAKMIAERSPISIEGVVLVHYGGQEDPGGMLADPQQEARFLTKYPQFAGIVRYGQRGQKWRLSCDDGELLVQLVNKDHAYWWEKRDVGQLVGGNTSALITHIRDGDILTSVLIDAGFGTITGLLDLSAFSWSWPMEVLVTHGHIDHHAELMALSELWCKRYRPTRSSRAPSFPPPKPEVLRGYNLSDCESIVRKLQHRLSQITADPFFGRDAPVSPPKVIPLVSPEEIPLGTTKTKLIVANVNKPMNSTRDQHRALESKTFFNIEMSPDWTPTPETEIIARSSSILSPGSRGLPLISSGVMYQPEYHKVVMWSASGARDPDPAFLRDLAVVAQMLAERPEFPFIAAMNLEGSGASTPNHTHIHFLPITGSVISVVLENIAISDVLENIRPSDNPTLIGEITLRQITGPTWGFVLDVECPSSDSVEKGLLIARVIDVCVYRAVTLGSNHQFGFSLVLDSRQRSRIIVLVRSKELECPFSATAILDQIRCGLASKLRHSAEATWKWGWLECLGGLKLDQSRNHAKQITPVEWSLVFANLKPSATRRAEVLGRVAKALNWLQTAS